MILLLLSLAKVDLTPKIMNTLNQELAGSVHPKTGIPFNSKVVELPKWYKS